MIITKEMFDEFVESAENHTILWTDTLALIGVTVGDVPDVDVIGELEAEIVRLRVALFPFAEQAYHYEPEEDDGGEEAFLSRFLIRHLRAARAALAQETQP
jgi:hypothetical protein